MATFFFDAPCQSRTQYHEACVSSKTKLVRTKASWFDKTHSLHAWPLRKTSKRSSPSGLFPPAQVSIARTWLLFPVRNNEPGGSLSMFAKSSGPVVTKV